MDYILLPFGYAYNKEWAGAKRGDIIRFYDGADRRIFAVRKLKMSSPTVDILARMRYGLTIKGCLSRWKTNAILEGNMGRAVSPDTCLMVAFEMIKEEEETEDE